MLLDSVWNYEYTRIISLCQEDYHANMFTVAKKPFLVPERKGNLAYCSPHSSDLLSVDLVP